MFAKPEISAFLGRLRPSFFVRMKAVRSLCRVAGLGPAKVWELAAALSASAFADLDIKTARQLGARWDELLALQELGARPYIVIGDSHSQNFRRVKARDGGFLLPIHILCGAGSALGLHNPKSKSGYGAQLAAYTETLRLLPGIERVPILLQFGQVDVEFVYNFRRMRGAEWRYHRQEALDFCHESTTAYTAFIDQTFLQNGLRPALLSIFPPALSDAAWCEGYVNAHVAYNEDAGDLETIRAALRKLQIPDLQERTFVHRHYHKTLQERCLLSAIKYWDAFDCFLGPQGVLNRAFIPDRRGFDHHLEYQPTEKATVEILWAAVTQAALLRANVRL
jgi:hypothetical protein